MKLSIGFEFQCPELSILPPSAGHLNTLSILTLDDKMELYGDNPSKYKMEYKHIIESYTKSKITELLIISKSKTWSLPNNTVLTDIFNDAEFVITFKDPINTHLDELPTTIKQKIYDAFQHLMDYIQKQDLKSESLTVYEIIPGKRRRRDLHFPFKISISNDDLLFLSRHEHVKWETLPFFLQCTFGTELQHVVSLMTTLVQMYGKDTILLELDKYSRQIISPLCQSLFVLYMYHIMTQYNRKASIFIIRHLFASLLKLMNFDEFTNIFLKAVASYSLPKKIHMDPVEFAKKLYHSTVIESSKDMTLLDTQKRIKLKNRQNMADVSTFSFPNQGLHTWILFEFRHFHYLFNKLFFKKSLTEQFLSWQDIQTLK